MSVSPTSRGASSEGMTTVPGVIRIGYCSWEESTTLPMAAHSLCVIGSSWDRTTASLSAASATARQPS